MVSSFIPVSQTFRQRLRAVGEHRRGGEERGLQEEQAQPGKAKREFGYSSYKGRGIWSTRGKEVEDMKVMDKPKSD